MADIISIIGFVLEPIKDIIVFLIVLSVLIIVHEWGHYITARKCGVKVDQFSLGFGKKLFSWKSDGTEFKVCLIPLGGYVKMAGDERTHCTGVEGEFYSAKLRDRSLIVINGPAVNFALAYIFFVVVFMLGYPDLSTKVAELIDGHPAKEAGLQVGDTILAVNEKPVYGFTEMQKAIEKSQATSINFLLDRNGETITKTIKTKAVEKKNVFGQQQEVKNIGIGPYGNRIRSVSRNSPASLSDLKEGDQVVAINGNVITGWTALQKTISGSSGETIEFKILRDSRLLTKTITPKIKKKKARDGSIVTQRFVGINPEYEKSYYKFGFFESLGRSFNKLVEITVLTYKAIYYMIVGSMSAKENMAGIVGIYQVIDLAAEEGFSDLLYIIGVISASLAIFNLLPIIPLDGGHLLLNAVEKLRGKSLSAKTDDLIARVGFSLIICLAIFVFYIDFARIGLFEAIGNLWR